MRFETVDSLNTSRIKFSWPLTLDEPIGGTVTNLTENNYLTSGIYCIQIGAIDRKIKRGIIYSALLMFTLLTTLGGLIFADVRFWNFCADQFSLMN